MLRIRHRDKAALCKLPGLAGMRRKENGALKRIGMMAERETGGVITEEIERIEATKATKATNGAREIRETKETKEINGAKGTRGIREIKGTGGGARKEKTAVIMIRMTMREGTNGMVTGIPGVGKVAEAINESFCL